MSDGTRLCSSPRHKALYVERHMLLLPTRSSSSPRPIGGNSILPTITLSRPWMRHASVLMVRSLRELLPEPLQGGVAQKVLDGDDLGVRTGGPSPVGQVAVDDHHVGVGGDRLDGRVDHGEVVPARLLHLLAED